MHIVVPDWHAPPILPLGLNVLRLVHFRLRSSEWNQPSPGMAPYGGPEPLSGATAVRS